MKETLSKLAEQTGQLLRKMSVSQRISLAMLAGVVVVSLITLAVWNGSARTDQVTILFNIEGDKAEHVKELLAQQGIEYDESGGNISVPRAQESRARAALGSDAIFQKEDMFTFLYQTSLTGTESQRGDQKLDAVRRTIRAVLRSWSGVQDAEVVITGLENNRFVSDDIRKRRASVNLKMGFGEELGRERVEAISMLVTGAVRGLDPKNVHITANGRFYSLEKMSDEGGSLTARHRHQEAVAQIIADKIRKNLEMTYTRISQSVYVHLRLNENHEYTKEMLEPLIIKEIENISNAAGAQGEPESPGPELNVNVNRPTSNASSGGSRSTSSKEEIERNSVPGGGGSELVRWNTIAGQIEDLNITVVIPYIEAIMDKAGETPEDQEERDRVLTANLTDAKDRIAGALPAQFAERIKITAARFREPEMPEAKSNTVAGLLGFAQQYGGTIALFAFAAVALFMITSMVKKSVPAPVAEQAEWAGSIDGQEEDTQLDDEDILKILNAETPEHHKAEVYRNRIHKAIEEDTQAAVELVKRWLVKET